MHAQTLRRIHTGFDSVHFYTGSYNSRWPHSPEEYTLRMSVDVEKLKLEKIFSQPAISLQCDSIISSTVARGRYGVGCTRSATC